MGVITFYATTINRPNVVAVYVQLYLDGSLFQTFQGSGPYSATWSNLPPGTYNHFIFLNDFVYKRRVEGISY